MRETVTMSEKDLDRLHILRKVQERAITQVDAARILNLSDRQVRNLLVRLHAEGVKGIISRRVGKPSNRRIADKTKSFVINTIEEKYPGFGPTLATEKLAERDGLHLSKQTVRNWMIEAELWTLKKAKKRNLHPPRRPRPCFGELIQGDGSRHRWFGVDGPMVNATVFIDDATSTLTALLFSEQECLDAYYVALDQHVKQYGRPRALYTDHWASFRKQKNVTQAQKALESLEIELILAGSPQAKGRVERANRTLQDRLVKELFLRDIRTIEEANAFAPEFVKMYNEKFSKEPMSSFDAHRPSEGYDLERILCPFEQRSLNSCGIFQFKNEHYQLQGASDLRRLAKRKIEVRETQKGRMRFFLGNKEVKALRLDQIRDPSLDKVETDSPVEMNRKQLLQWNPRTYSSAASTHPWKRCYHNRSARAS